jgi:hypothetical protein
MTAVQMSKAGLRYVNAEMRRPIANPYDGDRSPHYVEGRKTKAENPHVYRLSYFVTMDGASHLQRLSADVNAWLKRIPDDELAPMPIAEYARRAPSFARALREYAERQRELGRVFRAADAANRKRPPLIWHPISAARASQLSNSNAWRNSDPHRARSISTALKRGDVIPNIPNIIEATE